MSGRGETVHVYLLEVGCYDQAFIEGVYATAEAAMSAHTPKRPKGHRGVRGFEYGKSAGEPWSYEWSGPSEDGGYGFGADWDDAASIRRYEVQGAADTASATATPSPPSSGSEGSCSGVSR